MDKVKLALEMNKLVHDECKDVPHDIGIRLFEIVTKHLNLRKLLLDFANYLEDDKHTQTTDECVDNYLDEKKRHGRNF